MDNVATATFAAPAPQRQTTNEAITPWGDIILTGLLAVIVFFGFCWGALVFIFSQAGYRHPGEEAASAVLTIAGGGLVIVVVVFVSLKLLGPLFAGIYDLGQSYIEMKVKVVEIKYQAAQQLSVETAHRMTTKDKHQYQLVMYVMERTFSTIDEAGKIQGAGEPFSRRRAGAFVPYNETDSIGEHSTLAIGLRQWLFDKNILLDDRTVNVAEFPDIQAVQRVLMDDPKYSIVSNKSVSGMSGHYIEHGNESWA